MDELEEKTSELTDVQISDEALCPRYCGMLVKGVKVGPSPEWLKKRVEAMGLRPINNVVDVSNYVLFATAQPIHTFDHGKLAGGRIIVRRAKKGEKLPSLDGKMIELSPDMLVIADEAKPVALAGVMGGEETGVTEKTWMFSSKAPVSIPFPSASRPRRRASRPTPRTVWNGERTSPSLPRPPGWPLPFSVSSAGRRPRGCWTSTRSRANPSRSSSATAGSSTSWAPKCPRIS